MIKRLIHKLKSLFVKKREVWWVIIEPRYGKYISNCDQKWMRCTKATVYHLRYYREPFLSEKDARAFVGWLLLCRTFTKPYKAYVVPDSQYKELMFDFKEGLTKEQIKTAPILKYKHTTDFSSLPDTEEEDEGQEEPPTEG